MLQLPILRAADDARGRQIALADRPGQGQLRELRRRRLAPMSGAASLCLALPPLPSPSGEGSGRDIGAGQRRENCLLRRTRGRSSRFHHGSWPLGSGGCGLTGSVAVGAA